MFKFFCFIITASLIYPGKLFSQEKFEKESRIFRKDVPAVALGFVDSIRLSTKAKWYKEEGKKGKSIEAKFMHQKSHYSIEFDTLGIIEDIEMGVKWEDVHIKLRDSISLKLFSDCEKHHIVKVQQQFTGNKSELLSLFKDDTDNQSVTIKYELIVRCDRKKKADLYEYLFDDTGQLISRSKIVFKNSSHLEY